MFYSVKYLFTLILFTGFLFTPAFAQEVKNPSLIVDQIEISAEKFNVILRDSQIVNLDDRHSVSWQVTIDNNLLYGNPFQFR